MNEISSSSKFAHYKLKPVADLKLRLAKGMHVSAKDLAQMLKDRETDELPAPIIEYIAAVLAGEVKKPRGRPRDGYVDYFTKKIFAPLYYDRMLEFVQDRKTKWEEAQAANPKRRLTERDKDYGWGAMQGKDFWVGGPHERAARITAQRLLGDHNAYKTILNSVSSEK